jgi:F420-dependent oxidoreductase-like protein
VRVSLMIEGQNGLDWPRWKRLVAAAEDLGFAGLFRSDHFTNARPPDKDSLEMVVSLAYLADHTRRVHFGSLVAPLSIRHPALLARQAAALDDLSDGRMILGLGAGWQEREHTLYGFALGDVATRMARLEEGVEVVASLLRSDEPVTFDGRFYQLRGATLLPRPRRPGGPRLLIGGNGARRTLPLVERHADIWNAIFLAPDAFRERSQTLDELLRAAGRHTEDVARTLMTGVLFARDEAELERKLAARRQAPALAGQPLDAVVETMVARGDGLVGTPDMIRRQLQTFERAGVQELMAQWLDLDDLDGLRAFAEAVRQPA